MAEQACAEYKLDVTQFKPIFVDVIKYGLACQRIRMGLSANGKSIGEPNGAYDYCRARQHLIKGIQAFVQAHVSSGLKFHGEAQLPNPILLNQKGTGESLETGALIITYSFTSPTGDRLPDIKITIDHVSSWSVTADVDSQGKRYLTAVHEAWDWRKILDAVENALRDVHRELLASR